MATQLTHRARRKRGTPTPLARVWHGGIRDHGKRHLEPWKQSVTGRSVHSPGGGCLPSSRIPQLKPQG